MKKNKPEESLALKWGTLKECKFYSPKAKKLLKEYQDIGFSCSAITQTDTPRQKEIICKLIDVGNFKKVYLEWDGVYVEKEKAKRYILEYGKQEWQNETL